MRSLLERIWDRVESAVLMSATLALPDVSGIPKASYLAHILSVPSQRMRNISPIVQPWLYSPALIETAKGRKDLVPPKEDESGGSDENAWSLAIADELCKIALDARGGTLALTSSYDRIALIASALAGKKEIDHVRLVVQKRETGVRLAQAEFEQKAKVGLRPIWIAAGGAWTGLDVSDKTVAPEQDFLLTDLAIINIPFGTNRSTTHQSRMEWMGTAERDRAALEFKQGIGRLMRRGGLTDRRLHILDARVWDKRIWYAPFRKILAGYTVAR
jgi:ATP-dependent DNA helicase DinG